jgi:hypothetical protein
LEGVECVFAAGSGEGYLYRAELEYADGRKESREIFAPNGYPGTITEKS